jgi:hypothetical protein
LNNTAFHGKEDKGKESRILAMWTSMAPAGPSGITALIQLPRMHESNIFQCCPGGKGPRTTLENIAQGQCGTLSLYIDSIIDQQDNTDAMCTAAQ